MRWVVWAAYSAFTLCYSLWQLKGAKEQEESEDNPENCKQGSGDSENDVKEGDGPSSRGRQPGSRGETGGNESNGSKPGSDALSMSGVAVVSGDGKPLSAAEAERSEAGPSECSGEVQQERPETPPPKGCPGHTIQKGQLAQAVVNMGVFMLLTALSDGFFLQPRPMLWVVLALAPLFPLIACALISNITCCGTVTPDSNAWWRLEGGEGGVASCGPLCLQVFRMKSCQQN